MASPNQNLATNYKEGRQREGKWALGLFRWNSKPCSPPGTHGFGDSCCQALCSHVGSLLGSLYPEHHVFCHPTLAHGVTQVGEQGCEGYRITSPRDQLGRRNVSPSVTLLGGLAQEAQNLGVAELVFKLPRK